MISDRDDLLNTIKKEIEQLSNKEAAQNAFVLLFPELQSKLKVFSPSPNSGRATKRLDRRLSVLNFAPNYFTLHPTLDFWGRSEFEKIINSSPREAFKVLEQKLSDARATDHPHIRKIFLDLLDEAFSTRPIITSDWLIEISRSSRDLVVRKDTENRSLFAINNFDRLRWIIINGLEKIEESQRFSILSIAIEQAPDLGILASVTRNIVGDLNPKGATGKSTESDEYNNNAIRDLLLERIRHLSQSEIFWHQTMPDQILWFWWGTNNEGEVRQFTNRAMDTPIGLARLLECIPSLVRSSSGDYESINQSWKEIVDLEKLADRARNLTRADGSDLKNRADRFLRALAQTTKGSA